VLFVHIDMFASSSRLHRRPRTKSSKSDEPTHSPESSRMITDSLIHPHTRRPPNSRRSVPPRLFRALKCFPIIVFIVLLLFFLVRLWIFPVVIPVDRLNINDLYIRCIPLFCNSQRITLQIFEISPHPSISIPPESCLFSIIVRLPISVTDRHNPIYLAYMAVKLLG